MVIQRVTLRNFKAFERFRLDVRGDALLAGPNNAGKSTLIQAIRTAAQMLRIAFRRNPNETFYDGRDQVLGYSFNSALLGLDTANLQHEFRDVETRMSLRFQGGSVLTAVWPADTDDSFFYLQSGRASINNLRQARDAFPEIGTVPVLSPVDTHEEMLTPKYVRENVDGRLASRHFRNQLYLLAEDKLASGFDAFRAFAHQWTPEMRIKSLRTHSERGRAVFDLYYTEAGRRAEKELVWAGDGMQIWLQLLLHIFRLRERGVLVLDEPDVFLHPDLQRRLVWLLDSLPGQTITATHSSEVLVEAAPEAVVWVDKTRTQSVSAPNKAELASLSASLGTRFNLPMARALRAKCVLFVEGDDAKTLRQIARVIGAQRVASETGIAVMPLRGFDNWEHVEPFTWMSEQLLEGAVEVFVVLDRDYRADSECAKIRDKLRAANVRCHLWRRKELESYLLETPVIARLVGAPEAWVESALEAAAEESEGYVYAQITARALGRFRHDKTTQAVTDGRSLTRRGRTRQLESGSRPRRTSYTV
jgi:hypothetical protein